MSSGDFGPRYHHNKEIVMQQSATPLSATEQIAEVIARLDVLERSLMDKVADVRELRHTLFETLDSNDDELVD